MRLPGALLMQLNQKWNFCHARHGIFKNELSSSEAVYRKFAEQQYGTEAAKAITPIINQNEPFASDWSECRWTPPFEVSMKGGFIQSSFTKYLR